MAHGMQLTWNTMTPVSRQISDMITNTSKHLLETHFIAVILIRETINNYFEAIYIQIDLEN